MNIYKEYSSQAIFEPKVKDTFLRVNFPSDVWPKLSHTLLKAGRRQIVAVSIDSLIRNKARLFQQGRTGDAWCQVCPRVVPLMPPKSDVEHIFCSCTLVREAWMYVRILLTCHQPELLGYSALPGGE